MSKGRRLREQRRAEKELAASSQQPADLMTAILDLESPEEFIELIQAEPSLLDGSVVEYVEEMREVPGFDGIPKAAIELLRQTADGVTAEDAWSAYQHRVKELERIAESLEGSDADIERASAEGRYEDVLSIIEDALPRAKEAGLGILYCLMHLQRAKSLLALETGKRAENLEAAIASAEEALGLQPGPEAEADAGMTLGLIWMERLRGDPRENVEVAIGVMEKALGMAREANDPNLVAIIENNLANALHRRSEGDRVENLENARAVCESALVWRTPTRDVVDWAHTQLTLGVVLESLAYEKAVPYSEAQAAFGAVPEKAGRGLPEWLIGRAHSALGGMLLRQGEALVSPDRLAEKLSAYDGDEPPEEGWITEEDEAAADALYAQAAGHFELALELTDPQARPFDYARLSRDAAVVLAYVGEEDAALEAALDGLHCVGPEGAPRLCAALGAKAGSLLADAGRWEEAAPAYSKGLEAAELLFHGHFATVDRESEQESIGNHGRWAAAVLARTGQLERSAEILEASRARELRRRLAIDPAAALPEEIAGVYREAAANLRAAPLGAGSHEVAETLQRIVTEIRAIPGLERFDMGPSWEEIAAAAEPGWPLAFLNPTPQGVQFLVVSREDGAAKADCFFFDGTDSHEMIMKLFADDIDDPGGLASYFFAVSRGGSEDEDEKEDEVEADAGDIERALDYVLPWFGERVARPLRDAMASLDCEGLSIVPCGSLALVPIHACTWNESDGHERCLLDEFPIRYAPSATVLNGCRYAAESHEHRDAGYRLLGNPTPQWPLEAAEAEVVEIAELLGVESASVAVGLAATSSFLAGGSGTTHVHLACHASASITDLDQSVVLLGDGPLRATELGRVIGGDPRLVVVSACQSAIPLVATRMEESLSLSSAFLAAGSACVIATMWPVDDFATAVLMVRLYEEMQGDRAIDPPRALRRAQLWLRDLTDGEAAGFLDAHPELKAELQRRRSTASRPGIRLPVDSARAMRAEFKPYHWAGVVAAGV